jgi:hypothetical protein
MDCLVLFSEGITDDHDDELDDELHPAPDEGSL